MVLSLAMASAQGAAVFVVSIMLAIMEVEMEGQHGWAEKMPTFYRWSGKVGVKPVTGYHLFMMLTFIAAFHLPFVVPHFTWSLADEVSLINLIIIFFSCEDFLWFVFNPFYGASKFKKEFIWWHNSPWVLGMFPVDFLAFPSVTLTLSYLAGRLAPSLVAMATGWALVALSAVTLPPVYGRWYVAMRKEDHRAAVPIFHRLPPASGEPVHAPLGQVFQTDFSPGTGNALAACVASIHGLRLEDVPNFIAAEEGYLAALNSWLGRRGMGFQKVALSEGGRLQFPPPEGALCLLAGPSPRGVHKHVVVARASAGGVLVGAHDPHPDGTMLAGDAEWVGLFVVTDPRRVMLNLC